MSRPILASTLLILLGLGAQSRAGFVISVGSTTIAQGNTGSVDVYIRSDAPSGDVLSSAGFQFLITPGGSGALKFVSPQSDSQLTAANYLFAGNSSDLLGTPPSPVGNVTASGSTFTGGDSTNDLSNTTVTATPVLLATLDLTAASVTPPPGQNSTFTITLENNPFTTFQSFDSNGNPVATSFTSTSGTVTVTPGSVTVVPEPGPIVLLVSGATFGLALARRSRRASR